MYLLELPCPVGLLTERGAGLAADSMGSWGNEAEIKTLSREVSDASIRNC